VDTLDFTKAEKRAVSIISRMTPRLSHYFYTFENQPDGFVKQSVKEAIAEQVNALNMSGALDSGASGSGISSMSLGDFSMNMGGNSNNSNTAGDSAVSNGSIDRLRGTGLLYTGVSVR